MNKRVWMMPLCGALSTVALAQEEVQIEEVLVTADRILESIKDVPSAVSAVRGEDLDVLTSVADNIQGRTICALGDAAALPVKSFIKHFRSEFAHHIEHKRCLVPDYI